MGTAVQQLRSWPGRRIQTALPLQGTRTQAEPRKQVTAGQISPASLSRLIQEIARRNLASEKDRTAVEAKVHAAWWSVSVDKIAFIADWVAASGQ